MRYTLLEMVQEILRSMDGDEINSVTDTAESEAIAHIIKENFFNISGIADIPEHFDLFELEATGTTTPVLMTLPSDVLNIDWIKYNNKLTGETNDNFQEVHFKDLNEFIRMQETLNTDYVGNDTMTLTRGSSSIDIKYRTDKMPQWYTTWDNYNILFDSYDDTEDANLQKNKTMCYGMKTATFSISDTFVPDLNPRQFQLLLNESRSQAFLELKQQANPKSEKRARDNWINMQRTKRGVPNPWLEYNNAPNYGRKGPTNSTMIRALKLGS